MIMDDLNYCSQFKLIKVIELLFEKEVFDPNFTSITKWGDKF